MKRDPGPMHKCIIYDQDNPLVGGTQPRGSVTFNGQRFGFVPQEEVLLPEAHMNILKNECCIDIDIVLEGHSTLEDAKKMNPGKRVEYGRDGKIHVIEKKRRFVVMDLGLVEPAKRPADVEPEAEPEPVAAAPVKTAGRPRSKKAEETQQAATSF